MHRWALLVAISCFFVPWSSVSTDVGVDQALGPEPGPSRAPVQSSSATAHFIANAGQLPHDIAFAAAWPGLRLRIGEDRFGLEVRGVRGDAAGRLLVEQRFREARTTRVIGEDQLPGRYSYFKGNDPSRWVSGAPSFASVRMTGVADGVDVRWRDGGGLPEFDLLAEPGAQASDVVIDVAGATQLSIECDGSLRIDTALGPLRQPAPKTWHVLADGRREIVDCRYELLGEASYTFIVEGRDAKLALVVDPTVLWSTFLGGTSTEAPERIALHPSGDVIVTGRTNSSDFPVTPGVVDAGYDGAGDIFVSRLSSDGSSLLQSAILGGASGDFVIDLALVGGSVFLGGQTDSVDFPTTPGAFDETLGGPRDGFLTKLNSELSELVFSTLIGGSEFGTDAVTALDVDAAGQIVAVGTACTGDFPVTPGAFQEINGGGCDAFVACLDADGATLRYATFLGTSFNDEATSVVLTDAGVLVGGITDNPDQFPTTPGAYMSTGVVRMGFVSRLDETGSSLLNSTLVPGHPLDLVPRDGSVVVAGFTNNDAPTTAGAFDTTFGPPTDVYIQELDELGTQLLRATFFGGPAQVFASGFAVGSDGSLAFSGVTTGPGLPITPNAFDPTFTGGTLAIGFAARMSAGLDDVYYATYLGQGTNLLQESTAIALDEQGRAYVTGYVVNSLYETTPGAYDTTYSGIQDGYVTVFSTNPLWQDVGTALSGTNGDPNLTGTGILCEGTPVGLSISRGLQGSTASIVIGIAQIDAPFKGGTLVPSPDLVISGLPLDASGNLTVSATWPRNVPSGVQLYFQAWIVDPAAVAGLSSTAGLVASVP